MAPSQAASGTTAAVAIAETIVGSHMMKIDGFSETKDLGVGKSIKSSTFCVGGHDWYIEFYPCGVDEKSPGRATLFLCLSVHEEQVDAECLFFTLVDNCGGGQDYNYLEYYDADTPNAEMSWRMGGDVDIEREGLGSLLKDDCLQIICVVYIFREFPAVPPPYLHQLLSGDLFTVHRGLPGPSAHVSAPRTSAAGTSTAATISSYEEARSHVLTIEGYSAMKKLSEFIPDEELASKVLHVGGQRFEIVLFPSGHKEINAADCLAIFINHYADEAVKVRVELTLLNLAREIIASAQFCYAFTSTYKKCRCFLPFNMEREPWLLLGDSLHVKCDVTVVKEITPLRPPDLLLPFGNLLESQVGTDVEFEVGCDLFSAHKLVLATRSTAFMAQFFGSAGKGSSSTLTRVLINDMEPGVFKALLHFIYTDTLPEMPEDDKVRMAQGLLVAADQYAMERLKLICADMLCNYMNDASTAIDTLELADKHGCRRLKEKCMKLLKDHFAKVAP